MKKFPGVLSILFVLWLFAVFGGFYAVQKPFTLAAAAAIARGLLDLLAAAWLGLLGLGLGHRLLTWLQKLKPSNPPALQSSNPPILQPSGSASKFSTEEILILGCGLGLGALGLATLGLGLAGLFYPWLFVGLSALLTLALWPDFLALYRRLHWPTDRPHRLTLLYLGLVGLFTLAAALLPPIDWDGLFYHLTAPKLFIQAHRISPGHDIPHFNFPFLAEMLFTYAMLLRGDVAAKLIHTLYGLLLTGLVYLTAQRHLSRASAWPAVLILLSMPMIVTLAGWAYNDLALAFYQLAALYSVLNYLFPKFYNPNSQTISQISQEQPPLDGKWLILGGVFAGLAMGLKYTSFIGPLTIGLILVGSQMAGGKWQMLTSQSQLSNSKASFTIHSSQFTIHNFKPVLSFALTALLVALPWYLKNFFFTGNPFYPFLSGIFDGLYWDSFRAAWYAQAGSGIGFDLKTLAALPVLAMLGVRDVNYFDGRTGPLFLVFLPLLLLYGLFRYRTRTPGRPPALDVLLIFALAQFLFWTFGVIWSHSLWQSRLLLPCLAALSPAVAWLWQDLTHLDRPQFSTRRFVNLLIGLALALNLVELSLNFVQVNPLAYLTGSETRSEYLTRRLGAYYATLEKMNGVLSPQAVVLFLWEPRSYFCQVECRPDSILDQLAHDQYLYGSAAKIVEAWQKAGITHILLHRQGLEFIKHEDLAMLDQPTLAQLEVLEAQHFEPVFDVAGAYQLYRLK
ncbi:MAG: phospholipid carrier-dependent glycosyltransferase [Anaerolineales bacterium]|nr:phospholipid carrier-dependent glycosyltransferase [Anaerolineales bacterium]